MTWYGVALLAYLSADTADLITTRLRPGIKRNPIAGTGLMQQVTVSAGADTTAWYLTRQLWHRGHRRLAVGILVAGTAAHGWAAVHNASLK